MYKYRACVVDDSEDSAAILREGLRLNGYDVLVAHSGEAALEICGKERIDLVLLDVCMSGIDGYEVCKRLKADPKTKDAVVIFVTVKGSTEDVATGFRLGAADYITKPYNLPIVMVRVEAAMRARKARDLTRGNNDSDIDTAYTDHLTGLRNRRFLLERLEEEVEKAHRHDYPVSCLMFDVDEVGAVDDELGPVSMDDLLVEVAMALRSYTRNYDILARYDGTTFAVILPHTPLKQAIVYAKKIVDEVENTTFCDPSFPTLAKLSVGVTCCQNGSARGAEYVLGEAMRGLLQAKNLPSPRIKAVELG